MTYLQLMIKCLTFFKNQKEKFDSYDFYYYWLGNDEEEMDSYYKSKAKKSLMYLILLEAKNSGNANNSLLKLLERELSYFDVSLYKTFEKAEENTIKSIEHDYYKLDQICLLEQDELSVEEQKDIISEVFDEFKKHIFNNFSELYQLESAIHNVMEMVSQIIPELFFTEKGYEYISSEYQIDDPQLRESCYEYLKQNIKYYNSNRIYKVDEDIYNELYEIEEDFDESDEYIDNYGDDEFEDDEESLFFNDDEIRGQVDIYGEDVDNYDILYYSITSLVVMLKFIKNKQYDKIKKMMEIDEAMTNTYDGYKFNYDKTLIEALYQPKTMEDDYHREILTSPESDFNLDYFLSNNEFTQQYNIQQLALIIAHCFDYLDSKPINKIFKNSNTINNIFVTTDSNNQEEKIKKLVKIKKQDNQ